MSNQIAIKEVLNLDFFDYLTGKPLFRLDYCENTSITSGAETLDIRGGQGNYRLLSFDHSKNASANVSASILDLKLLGKLAGEDYTIGVVNVPKRQKLVADSSSEITLAETPVAGTLKVNLLEGERDIGTEQASGTETNANEYSISGTTISLNSTTAPEGTKIVVHYDYEAPATTGTIVVKADQFAPYMRVTGQGIGTDLVTGESNVEIKFDLLKAKPKSNINLTMSSSDASKMEFELDLFTVQNASDEPEYFKMYRL